MRSGDGLILRVRPHGAALSRDALEALAEISARFGNGVIDLTRRANLQLRGLRDDTLGAAQDALDAAGLLDASAELESVRNIVLSPLAGLDPQARCDGPAIARALEAGLAGDPVLHALPPKFSFLVDDGGRLPLGDIAADIRIEARGNQIRLAIGGDGTSAVTVALVDEASAAAAALDLARAFLRLRTGARTMREALSRHPASRLAGEAGLPPLAAPVRHEAARAPSLRDLYGRHSGFFGAGAPFGSIAAGALAGLAALAPAGVRLTPWRALLLPDFAADRDAALVALGLVTRADDPRLAVAACPGAPACSSGEVATRKLAERLAPLLDLPSDGIALHVSGCGKGCAHGARAPFTLVGRDGRYDLVVDGPASHAPTLTSLDERGVLEALAAHRPRTRALAS